MHHLHLDSKLLSFILLPNSSNSCISFNKIAHLTIYMTHERVRIDMRKKTMIFMAKCHAYKLTNLALAGQ